MQGRLLADTASNTKPYCTVEERTGVVLDTLSYRVRVGDMIYLKAGDRIPVDMIVLSTSSDGICYMETAPLDGETNLKQVKAAVPTQGRNMRELAQMQGSVECETPHHRLYSFRGNLTIAGEAAMTALDEKNLLLMGSVLKNTDWVIGLCVYAGPETKMGLNLKTPPSKFSRLDVGLNTYVFFIFGINFFVCALSAGLSAWWQTGPAAQAQRLGFEYPMALGVLASFLSYFALLNYMIPLSLVVTLEVARFLQAKFMSWDRNMYHEGRHCIAKTSNLNDELALVEYIFSDKTGTLTENLMSFRQCSVHGHVYTDSPMGSSSPVPGKAASAKDAAPGGILKALDAAHSERERRDLQLFLTALAVCHSVQADVDKETGEVSDYKAASPDEEALCKGARDNGYVYLGRLQNTLSLRVKGEEVDYEILLEIEFTSERRRMTMVLRDPAGSIIMFTKGADSVILERLDESAKTTQAYLKATKSHLDEFSKVGLRTLLFGTKSLSEDEWHSFYQQWHEASTRIEGRDEALDELADDFERDLALVGASAIEDKLQDGVPDTIANLRKAGIKIWVITGDKQETAINIGYSSKLLTPQMRVLCINSTDEIELEEILMQHINENLELDDDDRRIVEEWKVAHDEYLADVRAMEPEPTTESMVQSTIQPTNTVQKFKAPAAKRKIKKKKNRDFSNADSEDDVSDLMTFDDDDLFESADTMDSSPATVGSFDSEKTFPMPTQHQSSASHSSYGSMDYNGAKAPSNTPADSQSSFGGRSASNSSSSYTYSLPSVTDSGDSFRNTASYKAGGKRKIAVVVDGKTLVHILQNFRELFMVLARRAQSVVCNRVTPLQKAEIVKLVSQSEGIISLAIGDGGNDVSMIQQAHIGVGIQGREGNQAARASDFALPQFRHLQRLLTVHGRYCLLRNTKIIYYSIYKNTATFFPQFFFGFFNGFSAQSIYNQWVMMIFNIFLTSVPIFFLGLFEKDLHESIIERNPQVYQVHKSLKFGSLLRWFFYALYHASVIFWFTFAIFYPSHTVSATGRDVGLQEMGFYMMTMAIVVVTLRLALESVHWVFFTHFAVWGSLVFYFLARMALSNMLIFDPGQYGIFELSLSSANYWFSVILVVMACLLPIVAVKYLKRSYYPKEWYLLQERDGRTLSHGTAILGFIPDSTTDYDDEFPDDENYSDLYQTEQDERKPLIRLEESDADQP